ncbi:MAG: hypothetical protein H0T17_01125 [Propionibacteriales bacterium]|nr:hypothetical protein [Propionibacteriales bacterium]
MRNPRRAVPVVDLDRAVGPDYHHLPEPVDRARLVETHDVDPATPEIASPFATPDIADLVRTGAIGGAF